MKWFWSSAVALLILPTAVFASPQGKGKIDAAKVKSELQQILSSPEYDHSVKLSPFDRFVSGVGKFFWDNVSRAGRWLLEHLSLDGSSVGEVIATVAAWAMVAAFLVLLWFVARKLISTYGGGRAQEQDPATTGFEIPSASPLIRQAAQFADSGDFRGAFRAAYIACIAYLDEMRALRFERSRTNWEYLRELKQGGHEGPYSALHPLTLSFDRKVYGREDCRKEDYQAAVATFDRLTSEGAE